MQLSMETAAKNCNNQSKETKKMKIRATETQHNKKNEITRTQIQRANTMFIEKRGGRGLRIVHDVSL